MSESNKERLKEIYEKERQKHISDLFENSRQIVLTEGLPYIDKYIASLNINLLTFEQNIKQLMEKNRELENRIKELEIILEGSNNE